MNSLIILIVLILGAIIIYLWRRDMYDFGAVHPASIGGTKSALRSAMRLAPYFNSAIWHPAAII